MKVPDQPDFEDVKGKQPRKLVGAGMKQVTVAKELPGTSRKDSFELSHSFLTLNLVLKVS